MAPAVIFSLALCHGQAVMTCPFGWLGGQRMRFEVADGETATEDADTQRFLRDTKGQLSRWAGYAVRDQSGRLLYEFDLTVMRSRKMHSIAPGLRPDSGSLTYLADESDAYAYVPVLDGGTFVQVRVIGNGIVATGRLRRLAKSLKLVSRTAR